MMNHEEISYKFISLITNHPQYLEQSIIREEMIYGAYKHYFSLIEKSYKANSIVDIYELEQNGYGELYYDFLTNGISIDVKDEFQSYQRALLECYKKNVIGKMFRELNQGIVDLPIFFKTLKELEEDNVTELKSLTKDDIIESLLREDMRIKFQAKYFALQNKLRLEQHDLMTIAGGTGSGKSAMALNLLVDLSPNYPCLYFNMEMSQDQINQRLIAIKGNKRLDDLENFKSKDDNYKRIIEFDAENLTKGKEIKIITKSQRLDSLVNAIATFNQDQHFIVFIDHVGLIGVPHARNNTEKITEVYQTLRKVSLDYNCTIIALCQLNRESTKENTMPTLAALKDSSEAEQSSSKVCFIYENIKENQYYFNIAKNRSGSRSNMKMTYNKSTQIMEVR